MLALLIFQPTVSTFLHIAYLLKRARYIGQEVEHYKMKKILQPSYSILHLFNAGIITLGTPSLFLLSTGTLMLHLLRLLMIIVHKQGTGDIIPNFSSASRLILKVMMVLLTYKAGKSIKKN